MQEKGRLSTREIDRLVREAERYRAEDARYEERTRTKNQLEQSAYDVRNKLQEDDIAAKFSVTERETLEKVLTSPLPLPSLPMIAIHIPYTLM